PGAAVAPGSEPGRAAARARLAPVGAAGEREGLPSRADGGDGRAGAPEDHREARARRAPTRGERLGGVELDAGALGVAGAGEDVGEKEARAGRVGVVGRELVGERHGEAGLGARELAGGVGGAAAGGDLAVDVVAG